MSLETPEDFNVKEVKKFSKENAPEERARLARELWEQRREFFDKSQRRDAIVQSLVEQATAKAIGAEETVERIEEIEQILRDRKESLAQSVLYYFDSQRIEAEKADLEALADDLAKGVSRLSELRAEVEEQYVDRETLKKAREKLGDFYAGQERAWLEHQEAERARDVKNAATEHNAVFVHGIKDLFAPDDNSLLRQGVTLEQKLNILLAFEPTLSVSTTREGDTNRNLWSRTGVLLSGGRVLSAAEGDNATIASGLKSRASRGEGVTPDGEIAEDIKRSIDHRVMTRGGYNELVVENPEVAGLYICIDVDNGMHEYHPIGVERMLKIAEETNMPLYALQGGKVYEMTYETDPESLKPKQDPFFGTMPAKPFKRIFLGKEVAPKELTERTAVISSDRRNVLAGEILENSPFRLQGDEAGYVGQRAEGRKMFHDLFGEDLKKAQALRTIPYDGEPFSADLQPGVQVEVVAEVREPDGSWKRILRRGGVLYSQDKRIPRSVTAARHQYTETATREFLPYDQRQYNFSRNYMVHLSAGGFDIGEPLSKETFMDAVFRQVAYCRQQIDEIQKTVEEAPWRQRSIDGYERSIVDIAFYLYGLSEEADRFGNTEVRDKARQLAAKIKPLEEIQEVISRRINQNGGFRITRAEIE